MGQRRKKRYRSKGNIYPTIKLTGKVGLKYCDDYMLENIEKGDLQFYLFSDNIGRNEEEPGYEFIGGSGYLKARMFDGKEWQFVVMDDLLPNREHHFSKKEMPLDTFILCHEVVSQMKGQEMRRSYRNHYEPVPYAEIEDEDEEES